MYRHRLITVVRNTSSDERELGKSLMGEISCGIFFLAPVLGVRVCGGGRWYRCMLMDEVKMYPSEEEGRSMPDAEA